MDIIRATILKENIDDNLWLEFILAMIYVKNNWLTKAIPDEIRLYKAHSKKPSNPIHL